MAGLIVTKPQQEEYAPYYQKYIDLVEEEDILKVLAKQKQSVVQFFNSIAEDKGSYKYAPEKWSIKEIFGHLLEGERVFVNRALFFARQEGIQLPGYDHNVWVKAANFDSFKFSELIREFEITRDSSLMLFRRFCQEDWMKKGSANNYEITVRTIAYVMAGHITHHLNVIKEKYLED